MRILVTGHRGHVGAPVAAHLRRLGHDVVGFDRADGDGRGRSNVGARQYAAGMTNRADPGDSVPSPGRPTPGRKPPGGQLTPHDSVFRRILGVPENMASHLRAVLPPDAAALLDLGRLARVPGSFVDESLKWRHSDLLFTATLDGQDALVYVLVEHQSSSDPLMAFRMLRYVTRIWDRYLDDHPQTRQLPLVIPLVVHQGPGRWNSPRQLLDLIDLDPAGKKAMQACLPSFGYLLDDLAASLGPDAEEAYMTTAEMLRTEGRTEGLAEALVQVLTIKFGTLSEDLAGKVRAASSGQVQEWTACAVTAEKLDEVFG